MYAKIGFGSLLVLVAGLFIFKGVHTFKGVHRTMQKPLIEVNNPQDVIQLFAQDAESIVSFTQQAIEDVQRKVDALLALPHEQRSWENTAYAYDRIVAASDLAIWHSLIYLLKEVSPDESVRTAAAKALMQIEAFWVDLNMNPALYQALKRYAEGNALTEQLDDTQRYFIAEALKDFEKAGLNKPEELQEQIKSLKKRINDLCLQFQTNISSDRSEITVAKDELTGVSDDFIAARVQEDGSVLLGIDYPTRDAVLKTCSNKDLRKRYYLAYANRAYPANEKVLTDIIALRDELARMLGYTSYAAYEIDGEMANSVERVQTFLTDLLARATKKEEAEFALLSKNLPESVVPTEQGTLYPWDFGYVKEQYTKNKYALDDELLAQYFPMEKTIEGLLSIYEQFFGLRFKQTKLDGLWFDDVRVMEVYENGSDRVLSYLLLDLHPRPFKYSHACAGTIVPSTYHKGKPNTEVSIVIANFTKPTADKPSLLTPNEVRTFFHEFGHALHHILGKQKLASQSGTHVKRDFVEMPSQMLEEWLWDKDILKMVSGHYQTGEKLPDTLIDTIIALKNLNEGSFLQRQIGLGQASLGCYLEGDCKDVCKIMDDSMRMCSPHIACAPEAHTIASFGHLTGYGARYYGYLWSKVFALDLFNEIKKHGLLNPEIGKKYRDLVIGKGGSKDPNELLKDFLGREPNSDAFFRDLGL